MYKDDAPQIDTTSSGDFFGVSKNTIIFTFFYQKLVIYRQIGDVITDEGTML